MIEWLGPVVVEYYAATEGGGTMITSPEWLRKPGSVGLPWRGSQMQGPGPGPPRGAGGRAGPGLHEDGHVDVLLPRATRRRRDAAWADELFTVGDIGYLDEDGYLFLCDRSSDMIISGGVNIYPAEIESELAATRPWPTWPSSASRTTTGARRSRRWSSRSAGIDPGEALTRELLAFLASRVAKFKLPRTIDYVDELPRDPNGKLYKRKLRDPYWAGRDRAI